MRDLKRQAIPWIILAVVALAMYGCSFIYVIHVDGRVVSGNDQAPVAGAIITVGFGSGEEIICTSDSSGRWQFQERTMNPSPVRDREGNAILPIPLKIEAHGTIFTMETNIPMPDRGRRINGFVLTVLSLSSQN